MSPFDSAPASIWAPQAWVSGTAGGGAWRSNVLLHIEAGTGTWARIEPDTPDTAMPAGCQRLAAPLIPSLVNAHSHAFQRAFIGQAEKREAGHDDFWSWRQQMYGVASRITPDELRNVATRLYRELLHGGYTHTCEFHYLHHQADGTPYPEPWAMARALADAAVAVGMGLTILPVLYERAGFMQAQLRPDQRRFATTPASVLAARDTIRAWQRPRVMASLAVHSLRAATPASMADLVRASRGDGGPIHIHVAEQTAEVSDCLAATGLRPINWLLQQGWLDERWHLVHATHALPAEINTVAEAGATVVLCPTTEANLGDGIPDLPGWLAAGVGIGVGSDSQVGRAWPEELRWLEYAQRLLLRQRNVAALPGRVPSTAERLFGAAVHGGGRAAGFARWGLQAGAPADALLLDTQADALVGVPTTALLDALVFAAPTAPFARVLAAGCWRA